MSCRSGSNGPVMPRRSRHNGTTNRALSLTPLRVRRLRIRVLITGRLGRLRRQSRQLRAGGPVPVRTTGRGPAALLGQLVRGRGRDVAAGVRGRAVVAFQAAAERLEGYWRRALVPELSYF
jgi:hypothetical protein